jgi:hypothetical protein
VDSGGVWEVATTDDEYPLPALQRCLVVQALVHGCHHDACEHASDLPDGGEDGSSFGDFEGFADVVISPLIQSRIL